MLSLKGNPFDEDDDNVLDELNMMYLQCVQKAMKKGIQNVLKI